MAAKVSEGQFSALKIESPVPAITVQQPWAWAICFAGKRVENRPKLHPWESLIGETVLIHAGMSEEWYKPEACQSIWELSGRVVPEFSALRKGAVVAVTRILDVRPAVQLQNPWASGAWGLRLDRVSVLERPVDVRGKQGVWHMTWAALTREAREIVRKYRTQQTPA